MALPATQRRVPQNTDEEINSRIRMETEARISYFAERPDEIPGRLRELDQEWNIERTLEANAATLALSGTLMAAGTGRKSWLLLPAAVTAFLLQHAVQGWCPPLPVLRRLGFRTAREIEQERNALKALRGDFSLIHQAADKLDAVLRAVGIRR
jgi:hypothetical protein